MMSADRRNHGRRNSRPCRAGPRRPSARSSRPFMAREADCPPAGSEPPGSCCGQSPAAACRWRNRTSKGTGRSRDGRRRREFLPLPCLATMYSMMATNSTSTTSPSAITGAAPREQHLLLRWREHGDGNPLVALQLVGMPSSSQSHTDPLGLRTSPGDGRSAWPNSPGYDPGAVGARVALRGHRWNSRKRYCPKRRAIRNIASSRCATQHAPLSSINLLTTSSVDRYLLPAWSNPDPPLIRCFCATRNCARA